MQKSRLWWLLLLPVLLLLGLTDAFGQQRLRYTADKQEGRRVNRERIDYLIGNVVIRQQETIIHADSAQVQRQERKAEAFGRIRVEEGDSINITSKRLVYDGQTGTAFLYDDVVYRDGSTVLYTDNLEFNKFTGISSYHGGGRMIDNENTLTSRQGVFDKPNQLASFFGKVVLKSPDATVYSDTLYYNTQSGQARFVGFTRVVKNDGTITEADEGLTYNTQSENAAVLQGFIENQDYVITGNRLRYDRQKELFTAMGNVKMTAKNQDVIILGEEAFYDRNTGITRVYGRPVMKRPVQNDTLYMSADTMMAIESQVAADKRLLAWGGVRVFKEDLQGVADSLAYKMADSVLFFYRNPVLWSDANQMTGDTISMQIQNNQVERLRLLQNGFVVSKDTVINRYNQVKGRLITAFFGDNELQQIAVNGNGESIYFVLDDKDETLLMGMNRLTCSNMLISFGERTVQQIRFYQQPDAIFVPPHELQDPDTRLSGFQWHQDRRPSKAMVLSRKPVGNSTPAAGTVPANAAQNSSSEAGQTPKPALTPAGNGQPRPAINRPEQNRPAPTQNKPNPANKKKRAGTPPTLNKEDQ
ncbi:MAG: Organic solvent tolerance protein OstA [Bacteroidetes bacterium]|nr:Organic solvent tolerance protein OstA [Bacteroidota bacterium]